MGILSSFFDVVAGVSILAGRSSLLDTNLTTIAGRNFTVRGALGLSFLSVGFINLWATSRKQRKIERLTKDAEDFAADGESRESKRKRVLEVTDFPNHHFAYGEAERLEIDFPEGMSWETYEKRNDARRNLELLGSKYLKKPMSLDVMLDFAYNCGWRQGISDEKTKTYRSEEAPAAVMRTYKGRKSPALSAKSVKVGTRKRGNDGKMWQVRSVKSRGKRTQRWFKD